MTEAVLSNEIENQRRRLIVIFVGLCCAAAILVARLAYWQILRHDEMTRLADREHREVVTIAPRRGNILDRRGYLLATNITSFLVYGAPKEMGEPQFKAVADKVAPLLGLNSKSVQTDFQSNATRYYVLLKRRVPAKVVEQVNALDLPGIHVQQEAMRVYPADGLAEPLLGFANFDAQGANGVEGFYNNQIRGSTGSLVFERDTRGREIAIGYRELKPAEDGANLNLTLDAAIQHAAEKQLRDAIAANGASSRPVTPASTMAAVRYTRLRAASVCIAMSASIQRMP